ncbi:MAG: GTPase HflX [Deltaproteobacteria bacterium CG23_combo_of_CG06-09_8_20_14_all_51_20]|nr:GTPase HflX [bacterium]OIP39157.1 MAG: GTPase HflX [Desulfobacteraceae bacterium CG2_30_51_40]PIP45554.1 MAG: GTPase HflX [Deltaproteobacteria bacterium CG23_combo_of_CG06-09_8_20_14_all_51_20]PIY24023.1 MAG: GTPase HflX [Deltaproteobacteria bacterium CG_4_10_14_3_um_filter_51_14]PJB35880.1 MAG: GTPase HflX [Deltaproteobacteria bacterium CG_4_9_14_3_um_filter_51_14]
MGKIGYFGNFTRPSSRLKKIERIYGKTGGLKAAHLANLQRLYRRRIPEKEIVSGEAARLMTSLSFAIGRQVGILVSRKGSVAFVVVGDSQRIWIPDLSNFRTGGNRLRGLRLIHTHLKDEAMSNEDINDLMLLGLDLVAMVQVVGEGLPGAISYAHIVPKEGEQGWTISTVNDIGRLNVDFKGLIEALEEEMSGSRRAHDVSGRERALLVGVNTGPRWRAEEAMDELEELALSDGVQVAGKVIQQVKAIDARFFIGRGKLGELASRCVSSACTMIIFNNELSPTQVRNLSNFTELKIIDRSQLILDIFATRAVTREGKIQVELAQLKYTLPRLAEKNTAMSRLTGGIGGTGPGETKLEMNKRRVRQRIAKLNSELKEIRRQRVDRRRLRDQKSMPVISIVGYTNAGKSTLLNALTRSRVGTGSRLFETLDPTSRRLRFPSEREAVITDTVGFIRDLPESLMEAFSATLEELDEADLLLHVIDVASPRLEERIKTVNTVLERLGLQDKPLLLVLNKADLLSSEQAGDLSQRLQGLAVSAVNPDSLPPLIEKISEIIWLHFSIRRF